MYTNWLGKSLPIKSVKLKDISDGDTKEIYQRDLGWSLHWLLSFQRELYLEQNIIVLAVRC